jgi:hypothetical protein
MHTEVLSARVKQTKSESSHSSLSSVEVKNKWSYISTPHTYKLHNAVLVSETPKTTLSFTLEI